MRLIDADALYKKFNEIPWFDNADRDDVALEFVFEAPTIEAATVVHGRWKYHKYVEKYECMECGHFVRAGTDRKYCPHCGAKMDLPDGE